MTEGWLDSNVILRYLLNDHQEHSPRARNLIKDAQGGKNKLKVALHIVAEVVYVLEGTGYGHAEICSALLRFSRIVGIAFEDETAVVEALMDYRDNNVDFADALLMALARARSEKVWTFNRKHFKHLQGDWQEP